MSPGSPPRRIGPGRRRVPGPAGVTANPKATLTQRTAGLPILHACRSRPTAPWGRPRSPGSPDPGAWSPAATRGRLHGTHRRGLAARASVRHLTRWMGGPAITASGLAVLVAREHPAASAAETPRAPRSGPPRLVARRLWLLRRPAPRDDHARRVGRPRRRREGDPPGAPAAGAPGRPRVSPPGLPVRPVAPASATPVPTVSRRPARWPGRPRRHGSVSPVRRPGGCGPRSHRRQALPVRLIPWREQKTARSKP